MTFQLDTTGFVLEAAPGDWAGRAPIPWSALSPFTQGYIEALFDQLFRDPVVQKVVRGGWKVRFRDLAPETLARIISDCERFCASAGYYTADDAARFWGRRQAGGEAQYGFPPLPVQLGDDGKVRFA